MNISINLFCKSVTLTNEKPLEWQIELAASLDNVHPVVFVTSSRKVMEHFKVGDSFTININPAEKKDE